MVLIFIYVYLDLGKYFFFIFDNNVSFILEKWRISWIEVFEMDVEGLLFWGFSV